MPVFNLHHATFKQALSYAKLLSGMTNEEITEASGISLARIARYFQENDAYSPSPALIKPLCRAMGNLVLVDWFNAQVEELRDVPAFTTALELTLAVMEATKSTGVLNAKAADVLADGKITEAEAKDLQAQFRANALENFKAADALEHMIGSKA